MVGLVKVTIDRHLIPYQPLTKKGQTMGNVKRYYEENGKLPDLQSEKFFRNSTDETDIEEQKQFEIDEEIHNQHFKWRDG